MRLLVCLGLPACGVAHGDPSFWEPTEDVGGVHHDLGSPSNGGSTGYGGDPVYPGAGGGYVGGGSGGTSFGGASFGGTSFGGSFVGAGGAGPGAGGAPFGAGGMVITPGAGGAPVGPGSQCTFTFTVTTKTANGRFAPNNVGAIWIQNGGGTFEKTLEAWGTIRLSNATAWTSVSGSNTVDAITAATYKTHKTHSAGWNCTDKNRAVVPNGAYQVCATFAEDDAFPFFGPAPHMACAPFTLGAGPVDSSPPDQPNFSGMHISIQ